MLNMTMLSRKQAEKRDIPSTHLDQMDGLEYDMSKRRSKGKGFTSPGKLNTRRSAEVPVTKTTEGP